MIIGVCGFGYTGSGAVIDLLSEFETCCVIKDEFLLTYYPDGIEDLEYHLIDQPSRFFSSDIALRRFQELVKKFSFSRKNIYKQLTDGQFVEITNAYINDITDISWKGSWMIDPSLINNQVLVTIKYRIGKRLLGKNLFLKKLFLRDMNFSINPDLFFEKTQKYLTRILNNVNIETLCILNQPFPANMPLRSMKYFGNDTKAIIVDRDPRDLYILSRKHVGVTWIPYDCVEDFVVYYRKLRSYVNRPNILHIKFEDLIYNYEELLGVIMEFCCLTEKDHQQQFAFFDPKDSLKNTKLFMKNNEFNSEIRYIEKELESFLYDFTNSEMIDYNNKDIF